MGSATGGACASGDACDAWQDVSHRLPPIFTVRFG